MSSVLQGFAGMLLEHGIALLVGTTVILTAFALIVRYSRSLNAKNKAASTAMLALAGYLIVALVPMPRLGRDLTATPAHAQPGTPASGLRTPAEEHLFAGGAQLPHWLTSPLRSNNPDGNLAAGALGAPDADVPVPTRAAQIEATLAQLEPQAPSPSVIPAPILWLAGLIAGGTLLCTTHLLLGFWQLRRILARSQRASAELAGLVTLPTRTQLRIAQAPVQPFCCGLLRPTIVLPRRLAHPSAETRFVLLHERAHLTSGDTRARLMCALLRPLMFWHPLYWWLQRQLRFTSELLADDAAAQGSVADYVRCMMTLSTHPDPAAGGALVATIFRRRSELFRRLEMMLQRNEAIRRSHSPLSRWTRVASTIVLVALCAGTFGVDRAVAQSPRSDAIQKQVRELRAELARLRREIAELSRSESHVGQDPVAVHQGDSQPRTTTYTVKAGDSLQKIARRHYGSSSKPKIDDIRRQNPDMDPRRLRVGQELKIANARESAHAPRSRRSHSGAAARSAPPTARRAAAVGLPGVSTTPTGARRGRRSDVPDAPDAPDVGIGPGIGGATAPTPARLPGARSAAPAPRAQEPRPTRRRHTAPGAAGAVRHPGLPGAGPTPPRSAVATGVSAPPMVAPSIGIAGPAGAPGPAGPAAGPGAGPSRRGPATSGPSRRRGTAPNPLSTPDVAPMAEPPAPSNPIATGSRATGSRTTGPRATGPRTTGQRTTGPRTTGQRTTGPRTTGQRSRRTASASAPTPPRASGAFGSVADLVTRCIELRGDVEIQEVHVHHASSDKEMEIARIRLRTKKLQYDAIESMVKQELAAAESELARSKELHERGFISASEVQATESKIKLLARALR